MCKGRPKWNIDLLYMWTKAYQKFIKEQYQTLVPTLLLYIVRMHEEHKGVFIAIAGLSVYCRVETYLVPFMIVRISN